LFNDVGIVGAKPYTYLYYDKRTGKTYTSYNFNTLSLLILATLHSQWYTTIEGCSIKILPTNLSDILTPRAIAFWVACDGSYHKRDGVIYLSTDSYTLIEVQRLQTILLEKLYINSTYGTHGKVDQYRIIIAKASMPAFQSLIAEYLPSMMAYRAGL